MYVLADLVTQWGPQADFAEGGEETKVGRGFVTLPQVSAKSRAESGPYRPPSNRVPPPPSLLVYLPREAWTLWTPV